MDEVFIAVFGIIFRFFGAFLRWIYHAFQRPYSKLLEQDRSTTVGGVALGILTLITLLIFAGSYK